MADTIQEHIKALLTHHRDLAFLIDFDGTMVDLVPNPDEVYVPADLVRNINNITRNSTCAFAIVTGRTISKLDEFLGLPAPAIGSHGAEYRLDPKAKIEPLVEPMPLDIRHALHRVGDRHDCIFEDKAYSVSVHLPLEQINKDILPELIAALGDKVENYFIRKIGRTYEILPQGISKGSGISYIMKQPGFYGRKPVYIGDDVHLDESLQIVLQMDGILLPARHQHHVRVMDGVQLETKDVRSILADLGQTLAGA